MLHILITPFGKLRFREFFLTDILTSMVKVFVDIGYSFCYFGSGLFLERTFDTESLISNSIFRYILEKDDPVSGLSQTCWDSNWLYIAPILTILPYWWRLLQCARKYKETKNRLHLVNGGKYLTSIVVIIIASLQPGLLVFPKVKTNYSFSTNSGCWLGYNSYYVVDGDDYWNSLFLHLGHFSGLGTWTPTCQTSFASQGLTFRTPSSVLCCHFDQLCGSIFLGHHHHSQHFSVPTRLRIHHPHFGSSRNYQVPNLIKTTKIIN